MATSPSDVSSDESDVETGAQTTIDTEECEINIVSLKRYCMYMYYHGFYTYYVLKIQFFYYILSQLEKQLPNDDPTALDWHGHKYVVDNINKKFKPSKQRINHPGLDIHYLHGYAIYDG